MPEYERSYLQATIVKVKTETFDPSLAVVHCPAKHNINKNISRTYSTDRPL